MAVEIKSGVHWWTACTALPESAVMDAFPGGSSSFSKTEARPCFGQPLRRIHESGMELHFGSSRKDQPVVFNASGEVCETWSSEIIQASLKLGAYCTRVDLAVDVHPPEQAKARLWELHDAFLAGSCSTKMRKGPHGTCRLFRDYKETGGDTVYFGSTSGDAMLRTYDARGPLRLEWQFRPKGKEAGSCAVHNLVHSGVMPVWRWLTQSKLMFEAPWFVDVASGPIIELPADERVQGSLADALMQLRKQYGGTFFFLRQLGVTLEDIMQPPGLLPGEFMEGLPNLPQGAKTRKPDVHAMKSTAWQKAKSWCNQAENLGYNASPLRSFLESRNEDRS